MNVPVASVRPLNVSGVSTPPTKDELVTVARTVVSALDLSMSEHKIVRLALRFKDRAPQGNKALFFGFLMNAIDLSREQQQKALTHPDIARVLAYPDPVGEHATNRARSAFCTKCRRYHKDKPGGCP